MQNAESSPDFSFMSRCTGPSPGDVPIDAPYFTLSAGSTQRKGLKSGPTGTKSLLAGTVSGPHS
jgi:hypothetical protein